MPPLIDTHCHLCHSRLAGDTAVLDRAKAAGVAACICAAADLAESQSARTLSHERPAVWCISGIHPHEAKNAAADSLARIELLAADDRNVAIGEIGLDYHYDFSPRDVQRRVFAEQLQLAGRLGKPVVIHMREAVEDTLSILAESRLDASRVVFHSFTEGPAIARRILDLGASISFSGIVTFQNAQDLRQSALLVPSDRILVETDAPYLSPEPLRKMKTNEPANVLHVAARLAALRNVSLEEFAQAATRNSIRFFHLDIPGANVVS